MPGIVNTDSSTTCNVGAGPPNQQRGVSSGHTTLDKTQHSSNSSLTQPIQLQHPTQPQYTSHSKQHPTDSLIISYSYFVYSCNRRRALYLPAALETATVTIGAARCGAVRCGAVRETCGKQLGHDGVAVSPSPSTLRELGMTAIADGCTFSRSPHRRVRSVVIANIEDEIRACLGTMRLQVRCLLQGCRGACLPDCGGTSLLAFRCRFFFRSYRCARFRREGWLLPGVYA